MILITLFSTLFVNAHSKNDDYKNLYTLYSKAFDEMAYSKEYEKNIELDKEKYRNSKNRKELKVSIVSENGGLFPIEGTEGEYVINNSLIKDESTFTTFSNVAIDSTYPIYNGGRKLIEQNMYKYKAESTNYLLKKHKRNRVRFYTAKIISYFCLEERIRQMSKFVKMLEKLEKRFTKLSKKRGVSVLKAELISSRIIMYKQKLYKMKSQSAYSFGFLGRKTQAYIISQKRNIVKDFELVVNHDHKYKIQYCDSLMFDKKIIKMSSLAFKAEARIKQLDYAPRVEFRNRLSRQHTSFFEESQSDFRSGVFIEIPLFDKKEKKHVSNIALLKARRSVAELNYLQKQNLEYENAYKIEVIERKKLIRKLYRQIQEVQKKRYFNIKILKAGIIKVEDYLSLLDVMISTYEFYIDERWKYINTYFNNSLLCNLHKRKGV